MALGESTKLSGHSMEDGRHVEKGWAAQMNDGWVSGVRAQVLKGRGSIVPALMCT